MQRCPVSQVIIGDDIGNVQLLDLTFSDEVSSQEVADEEEESKQPQSLKQSQLQQLLQASASDAIADDGADDLLAFIDEVKLYPRVPVTDARKIYLPNTYGTSTDVSCCFLCHMYCRCQH